MVGRKSAVLPFEVIGAFTDTVVYNDALDKQIYCPYIVKYIIYYSSV